VIGLASENGDSVRYRYFPSYSGTNLGRLPREGVIDLNAYVPGYDREQVKVVKALIHECLRAVGIIGKSDKLPDYRDYAELHQVKPRVRRSKYSTATA
jgi:hypothetical protein